MADRPIPFSAPMVRALLDGRKTQTRRVIQAKAERLICRSCGCIEKTWKAGGHSETCTGTLEWTACDIPRYRIGDRLYVREHWRADRDYDDLPPSAMGGDEPIKYEADGALETWGWPHADYSEGRFRQGMHMPRWASRLTLIVTDVRVQRVQEISREDAIAEGLVRNPHALPLAVDMGCDWGFEGDNRSGSPVSAFAALWDSINAEREDGKFAWDANPWVAAYTFRPILGNIDQIEREAA